MQRDRATTRCPLPLPTRIHPHPRIKNRSKRQRNRAQKKQRDKERREKGGSRVSRGSGELRNSSPAFATRQREPPREKREREREKRVLRREMTYFPSSWVKFFEKGGERERTRGARRATISLDWLTECSSRLTNLPRIPCALFLFFFRVIIQFRVPSLSRITRNFRAFIALSG